MNIAILGAGSIAGHMAEALNGIKDQVCPYAIASRDLAKAQAFAEKWNFKKAYGSYEEMAADPDIDLVYIATPHSHHYEGAKLCIEHGKNVLVEKAFTANAKQAKELIDLAREKDVFMAEAMWTRYMPGLQKIREIIAEGRIGEVDSVEANFSIPISDKERMQNPALAGGALLDLGVYTLTFASMFLGDDIVSTESRCIKYATGVDGTDFIQLKYKDGRQAFLRTSMISGDRNDGKINGTKGYIEVLGLNDLRTIKIFDARGYYQETIEMQHMVNGYEYEVLACKKAIEAGLKECEEMPLSETMVIMEQMDALRKAWGVVYPGE